MEMKYKLTYWIYWCYFRCCNCILWKNRCYLTVGDVLRGDGSLLSNVISGVDLQFGGNTVGTAVTQINFVGLSSITAPVSGLSTITAYNLILGARVGDPIQITVTGTNFIILNRAGGDVPISL